KPYDGDLYVVGYDVNQNIHFLLVEMKENEEVILRVIEDEDLFVKLLKFYKEPNRFPSTEADEKLRLSIGESLSESEKNEQLKMLMTKLPISDF
ncbi:TPA: hypothetical protein NJY08_004881, partial [Salmonella enterica subsp. enterica serovar Typhi str. AG3]|nr:hypothetical protein [Salmonella enterica subsp. enterica serovar Typhi str. AG3]